VIDISSNITNERKEQYIVFVASTGMFLALVLILTFILTRFLRVTLLRPVSKISNVCSDVTTGNFSSRVNIKNKDEIGLLGKTVNTMVEGLYERFELSKYVSASTIQSLRDEKKGKRVPLTIMFSDIRGFTSFTEGNEPEMVVQYLNKILNVQTEIIQQHKGDVDKYVGDEIVALYHDTEPEFSACMTALTIQKEIEEKTAKLYGGLRVGIGINCGEVILGMIGSEKRADYTVVGDNVNTASRLCAVARMGQIIISNRVYEVVKKRVVVEGPYRVKLKGKKEQLRVYILKDIKGNSI
jgi:adenylate cyclase